MSGFYAADGSWNVTVVPAGTGVPSRAADGSLNVIASSGTLGSLNDPTGAIRVTISPGTLVSKSAPDGSWYVQTSPYTNDSGQPVTVVSGSLGGSPAAAFLARTTGLDSTHTSAYTTLINGLVTDGVWPKFDVLYVFATQDSTTSLLNLVSSSYTATAHGAPTFQSNFGYTGVDASSTVYLDSTFNPTTAPSPKFVQNSAHLSAWSNTNVTSSAGGGVAIGNANAAGAAPTSHIYPLYSTGKSYFRCNDGIDTNGQTEATSIGHFIATRSGASTQNGYINAVDQSIVPMASGAPANASITVLAVNSLGTISAGSGTQIASASIGGALTATDATNFYNRLATFITTVRGFTPTYYIYGF